MFMPHEAFTKGLVEHTAADFWQSPWDPEILYILEVLLGDTAASGVSKSFTDSHTCLQTHNFSLYSYCNYSE